MFGFGPVSQDGYGLGYIIKENGITICASSKHRQTQRFIDTLNSVFVEVRNLWKQSQAMQGRKLSSITRARSYENLKRTHEPFGRSITPSTTNLPSPTLTESENAYLGGYGYFDIGEFESARSRQPSPEPRHRRALKKEIGRKLRLADY
jgi:carnitine O-acetyltransferase